MLITAKDVRKAQIVNELDDIDTKFRIAKHKAETEVINMLKARRHALYQELDRLQKKHR